MSDYLEETPEEIETGIDQADQTEETDPATNLADFLCSNEITGSTEKIILCERLEKFEFEIGQMTNTDYDKYLRQCVIKSKNGKVLHQNIGLFNELVVLNHCLYPEFTALAFISKAGALTPAEALHKVLKLGEIEKLSECILKFNGFDRDFEALHKEAKN